MTRALAREACKHRRRPSLFSFLTGWVVQITPLLRSRRRHRAEHGGLSCDPQRAIRSVRRMLMGSVHPNCPPNKLAGGGMRNKTWCGNQVYGCNQRAALAMSSRIPKGPGPGAEGAARQVDAQLCRNKSTAVTPAGLHTSKRSGWYTVTWLFVTVIRKEMSPQTLP